MISLRPAVRAALHRALFFTLTLGAAALAYVLSVR